MEECIFFTVNLGDTSVTTRLEMLTFAVRTCHCCCCCCCCCGGGGGGGGGDDGGGDDDDDDDGGGGGGVETTSARQPFHPSVTHYLSNRLND